MKKVGQNSATDIITLHDQINEALEGLRGQGCCTENWDPLIIGFAIKKLDTDALRYLEELLPDPTEMPTLAQFMTFLRKRHRVLKANDKEDSGDPESKKKGAKKETVKKSFHLTSKMACFLCKEAHGITNCPKFQELTSYNKRQTALKLDLCLNCLSHKKDKECKSKRNCQHCDQKHHTLLHYEKKSQAKETKPKKTDALVLSTDNQEEQKDSEEFEDSEHVSLHTSSTSPLFPTILMKARANGGDWHYLRALLDTGSGDSFISERAAQELALPRERINAPIRGIGGSAAAVSKHQVQIILAPRFPSTYKLEVGALVLSSLTGLLPQQPIKTDSYKGLKVDNILMADPTFMTPGPIDMILGAQIYASILKNGIKRSNTISAQNTEFGWILTGSHKQIEAKYLQLTENETLTALGVGWDPNTDQFSYKIKPTPRSGQMDKRMILSDLASIYDPIGWLAPVTIRARLIMQRACKDQVDWNKPVSKGIVDDWKEFLRNLPEVEKIRIPRYMNYSPGANVQLHGFSDASEKAYGAVVYARVEKDSLVMILPLAAKTRVVPLDKPYTMPRLELCGAVLLAELLDMTLKTLDIADVNCHAWIDSKKRVVHYFHLNTSPLDFHKIP
uniref:Uncharacterized protein n=1 Tax=Phlebotomus papatasi TaxID=29031 RepID=A0A1B0DJ11_PHLPP